MKRIITFIIILSAISISTGSVFGDDCSNSCSIKDAPAPVLQEYIDNNRKIISNIANQLTPDSDNSIAGVVSREYIKIYNSITNWNTFSSWVDFLKIELSWEIPVPVKRDLTLIAKEWENLARFLKNSILQSSQATVIENACNGIENCQLSWTAWNMIWQLIENNSNIQEFYKLSILWKESSFRWNLSLVNSNFKSELQNYYNTYTLTNCSQCEWEFGQKITEAIKAISAQDQKSKEWIQKWKDAWNTLNGSKNNTVEYAKRERELLQAELSKQWVSWNNGEAILKNLDRYNNNAYSNQNNRLNNAVAITKESLESNANALSYASSVYQSVKQLYQKWSSYLSWNTPTVPISELVNIDSSVTSAQSIMREIDNAYQREIPFIAAQDTNSDKLQGRIIQMHIDLSQAINTLDKTIPFAQKVCNDQDRWNWRCKY